MPVSAPWGALGGHGTQLHQGRFTWGTRRHFCTVTVVRPWNRLPRGVLGAPSLPLFEGHSDNALDNMRSLLGSPLASGGKNSCCATLTFVLWDTERINGQISLIWSAISLGLKASCLWDNVTDLPLGSCFSPGDGLCSFKGAEREQTRYINKVGASLSASRVLLVGIGQN